MNHAMKRLLSAVTSLSLVWSLVLPAAASFALGEDLTAKNTELHQETLLSTNVFWSTSSSDLRTENFITYRPGYGVMPLVSIGSVMTERSTVTKAARELEAQGYRVLAGINGDFYNVTNGIPVGIAMTDGIIRSSDGGFYGIGFRADGTAVLGRPAITITADLGPALDGYEIVRPVGGVNKERSSAGGIYLYTYDFNSKHTTGNTEPGVDLLCNVVDGQLSVGETVTLQVEQMLETTGSATAIGPDQMVLSANAKADFLYVDALRGVPAGTTITLEITTANPEWNDVESAIGALYALVENGTVVSDLPAGAAPRTAVGQTASGDVIFYTIDGRRSGHSIGATMSQLAARMVELGCVTALCLDGGGSTTLSVTQPDQLESQTLNRPSDGSERSVSNRLFLVASNEPSGVLDHFYVQPEHSYVLAGTSVRVAAAAIDTNYIPMSGSYTLEASDGEVQGDTVFTPAGGGDITVTAYSGRSQGEATIHAIAVPSSVAIRNSGGTVLQTLTAAPGSTTQLSVSADYNHISLYTQPEAFTWDVTGDIGTIDEKGVFTALNPGSGTITATAGGKSATVQVTVAGSPLRLLEDFEDDTLLFNTVDRGSALSRTTEVEYLRLGRGAGRWDYTLNTYNEDGTGFESLLSLTAAEDVAPYDTLNFWVYGDNSGNTLALRYSDENGSIRRATVAAMDFSSWKLFSVSLTNLRIRKLVGFSLGREADITLESGGSGTLYLDHLLLSRNGVVDTQVPSITAAVQGTGLTATVQDAVDGVPRKDLVSVTYDGRAISFQYNEATGALSATLPAADGGAHRVTVTARDVSGNIGRASQDIAPAEDAEHRFSDTRTYWAADFCDFLYVNAIDKGYSNGTFRPDQKLTRLQFAEMLYNTLVHTGQLKPENYTGVTLPFADNDKISDSARPALRALVTEGIINGATGADGRLYFNPDSSLTRAQASAMIGRSQEKGYAAAEMTYTDKDSIPSYAVYYVQTMTAQGILGGYQDGTFKPGNSITRGQMAKILYSML